MVSQSHKGRLKKASPKDVKPTTHWVLLLGALFAVPAVSSDMYLPSLPDLMGELHTTQQIAQLTISATMLGQAIGQMVVGPILDRFGRRHPVMIGLTLHVVMSLLCALSVSIEMLILCRLVQGAANASANVTGMAVNRDKFPGKKGAQMMSRLMIVIGVAPLFAPTIGGLLVDYGGWRAVFGLLGLIGAILLVFVWRKLPETHPVEKRIAVSPKKAAKLYRLVLKDHRFACLALCGGLAQSIMMLWVMSAPFVTQQEWGFSPMMFSLAFAFNGVGLVAGAQVNAHLLKKHDSRTLLKTGLIIQVFLASSILILDVATSDMGPVIMVPIALISFFHNFVTANAVAVAVEPHGKHAGTASAFIGVCNGLIPAIVAPMAGFIGGTAFSMGLVMLIVICLNLTQLSIFTDLIFKKKKLSQ